MSKPVYTATLEGGDDDAQRFATDLEGCRSLVLCVDFFTREQL